MGTPQEKAEAVVNHPAFQKLAKRQRSVSIGLTLFMFGVYVLFLFFLTWGRQWIVTRVGETLTLAMPVGLGMILFAFILTGIYSRWANRHYDRAVDELKAQIQTELAGLDIPADDGPQRAYAH
jgi:uncharacterized membrane protein (DUF485 family)